MKPHSPRGRAEGSLDTTNAIRGACDQPPTHCHILDRAGLLHVARHGPCIEYQPPGSFEASAGISLNPHTSSAAGLEVLPDYLELPCPSTLLLIPDQHPNFLHNRWDKDGESCSSADVLIDWWGGLTAVRWLFV